MIDFKRDTRIANRLDNRLEEPHLRVLTQILKQGYELVSGLSTTGGERKHYFDYVKDLELWGHLKHKGYVEGANIPYAILVVSKIGRKVLNYIEQRNLSMAVI